MDHRRVIEDNVIHVHVAVHVHVVVTLGTKFSEPVQIF